MAGISRPRRVGGHVQVGAADVEVMVAPDGKQPRSQPIDADPDRGGDDRAHDRAHDRGCANEPPCLDLAEQSAGPPTSLRRRIAPLRRSDRCDNILHCATTERSGGLAIMRLLFWRGIRWVVWLLAVCAVSSAANPPLTWKDAASWNDTWGPTLSDDGRWFAYMTAPAQGLARVVVHDLEGRTEYAVPAGKAPGTFSRYGEPLRFSPDSRWLSFIVPAESAVPSGKSGASLPSVVVVNLMTHQQLTYEGAQSFDFPSAHSPWIAIKKPSTPQNSAAGASFTLILRQLESGAEVSFDSVLEFANDPATGRMALVVADAPTSTHIVVYDLAANSRVSVQAPAGHYRRLAWSPSGRSADRLAVLRSDSADVGAAQTLVVLSRQSQAYTAKNIVGSHSGKLEVSSWRTPLWRADGQSLYFGIRPMRVERADSAVVAREEQARLIIWRSHDRRLPGRAQEERPQDEAFNYLALVNVASGHIVRLADADLRFVQPVIGGEYTVGSEDGPYAREGDLTGNRRHDLYAIHLATGERRRIAAGVLKSDWMYWPTQNNQKQLLPYDSPYLTPDDSKVLWFEDGAYFVYDLRSGRVRNVTEAVPSTFYDAQTDRNRLKPPIPPIAFSADSQWVLLFDGWDTWKVPLESGTAVNLTRDGRERQIRYQILPFGERLRDKQPLVVDLHQPLYFTAYGNWTKKQGILRVAPGRSGGTLHLWGDAAVTLLKAKDTSERLIYTRSTSITYPDYYVTSRALEPGRRLSDANPQQARFAWSPGAKLVDFTSERGERLQAALYLPAGYRPGHSYPTIVSIYEELSQRIHEYAGLQLNSAWSGSPIAWATSNGYAVLQPDIAYRVNDPGTSALESVRPAVRAAAQYGVDLSRLALQGHSFGGYETLFTITHTNLFKAAIESAGPSNLTANYLDIYGAGNPSTSLYEWGQPRMRGDIWTNLDAYQKNSSVFDAPRMQTPLLMLHGDRDQAVPFSQATSFFNALRKLGKPVVLLQYQGAQHGLGDPLAQQDFAEKLADFYGHFLKGEALPSWWSGSEISKDD